MALHHRTEVDRPFAVLVAAVVISSVVACGPTELPAVPGDLAGTWRTGAPGYEHSYLRLESRRFTIGAGGLELSTHSIDRVDVSTDRRGTHVYSLHYVADEGYPDELVLTVDPVTPDRFVMGSAGHVWKRDG